jgi:hypothetical protein
MRRPPVTIHRIGVAFAVAGCTPSRVPPPDAVAPVAAAGAWVGVCAESIATPTARMRTPVAGGPGGRAAVVLADGPISGCTGAVAGLDDRAILWAGVASGPNTTGVDLIGQFRDGTFHVEEQVSLPAAPEPPPPDAPSPERWRAFGAEARATATIVDGTWSLTCEAGARPAGVVLRFAELARGDSVLRLEYSVTGRIDVLAADSGMFRTEQPVRLGTLDPSRTVDWFTLPWSVAFGRGERVLTFACPSTAAVLHLARALPRPRADPALYGAWFWARSLWREHPERILEARDRLGLSTAYVSPPTVGDSAGVRQFAEFVQNAARDGLRIWPVLGDPLHATDRGRMNLLVEVEALAQYARSAPADAALGGLQLDIEPYLIPGAGGSPTAWLDGYRATIEAVRRAWPYALDMVVPFWWSGPTIWPALQPTIAHMDRLSVTVMDYRTSAVEASRRAQPFLQWGASTGHRVHVALELGPIPDNEHLRFVPAASGTLWEIPIGPRRALLLVDRAGAPTGGRAFAEAFRRTISGGATSFRGDWAAFGEVARLLSADFVRSGAFGGITVHGADHATVGTPTCLTCPPQRPRGGRIQ